MLDKIKILYVDDEENNLVAFKANFRKIYDVYTANSAKEAFLFLESNVVHIIISDQKMPNTTGVEFLEQTVKLYPDCIRVILTGNADLENVMDAINHGQISKYVQKPWDFEKLELTIDNCALIYTSRLEIKLKNEALQKANNELNRLIYSVSHDLRSPLTTIMGLIGLTYTLPELKVAETYFKMIEDRVLALDSLIKKMIEYYKSGRDVDVKDEIDFKLLIEGIWNQLNVYNDAFAFDLSVKQDVLLKGDLFRFEIILRNILSNAIKYKNPLNQTHIIKVEIICNELGVEISIFDNGVGINPEYIDKIFDIFFRAENITKSEGNGIGLYIVREAVEKMKGNITVKSTPMKGTTFTLKVKDELLR